MWGRGSRRALGATLGLGLPLDVLSSMIFRPPGKLGLRLSVSDESVYERGDPASTASGEEVMYAPFLHF